MAPNWKEFSLESLLEAIEKCNNGQEGERESESGKPLIEQGNLFLQKTPMDTPGVPHHQNQGPRQGKSSVGSLFAKYWFRQLGLEIYINISQALNSHDLCINK